MTQHPRLPALAAIVITALAGVAFLAGAGQFRSGDKLDTSLEALEKKIIDCKDGQTWNAYGDRLRETGRFASAAKAYQQALKFQPDLENAMMYGGVALAQAGDADACFAYISKLTTRDPKKAVNLMGMPEMAGMKKDARWAMAYSSAQAQAMD
jgi:Flp pilus assembly protein TadD